MNLDKSLLETLKTYFLPRKGDTTVGGNIWPSADDTYNLGSSNKRFDTIYARNVVAENFTGTGGSADMVDGFHASATPQPNTLLALNSSAVFPTSVYPQALLIDGSRTLAGDLPVAEGKKVDGVDISVHASDGNIHHLNGMATDDHVQYVHNTIPRGITAVHTFNPTTPQAPFTLGGNAWGQFISGLYANFVHKQIVAGAGMTGGGWLNNTGLDTVTLDVAASDTSMTINPDGIQVRLATNSGMLVDQGLKLGTPTTISTSVIYNDVSGITHMHAVEAYADSTITGQKGHLLKSDSLGDLKLRRLYLTDRLRTPLIDTEVGQSLTIAPTQDVILSPSGLRVKTTTNVVHQSDNYASQTTGWRVTYQGEGDFRYLYADELHAKAFIADLEMALAGGQIITKSVALLAADFTLPSAGNSDSLIVEEFAGFTGRVFEDGDIVRLRQFTREDGGLQIADAWGTVTYVSRDENANPPTQAYTFTRSENPYSGAATGTIKKGTLALDYGQNEGGFHEINAIDGLWGSNSPYAQTATWSTHPAAGITVRTRTGNLRGIFSQPNEFGLYAGDGTADSNKYIRVSNLAIEGHNLPIKLYDGSNVTIQLQPGASNNPYMAMGNPIPTGWMTQTGMWAGKDGSFYKMYVGEVSGGLLKKGFAWDGNLFQVRGSVVVGPGVGYAVNQALLYLPLDGPMPYERDFQVNTFGHLGQQSNALYVVGAPGKYGKAMQIAEGTTNGCTNPSFETGISSWFEVSDTSNILSMSQSNARAYKGSYSLRITATAGVSEIYYTYPHIQGPPSTFNWYDSEADWATLSAYVYVESGTWAIGFKDTGSHIRTYKTVTAAPRWQRVEVSFQNTVGFDYAFVALAIFPLSAGTIYVDAVQYENRAYATPYFDGSMGSGHVWSGTAHGSASNRPSGARLTFSGVKIPPSGTISAWVNTTASRATSGSSYQWIADGAYTAGIILYIRPTNQLTGIVDESVRVAYSLSDTNFPTDTWHHIVLTWDYESSSTKLYLNGNLVSSGSYGVPTDDGGGWDVGHRSNSYPFNGWIDDFLLLDYAITEQDVVAIYNANAPNIVTMNPFELLLTGLDRGKVWGHAGGLYGTDRNGYGAFALVTESVPFSWGGFTVSEGDVVLGHNTSGKSAIFFDQSAGTTGFYGGGSGSPGAYINSSGQLMAGSNTVWLDNTGITLRSADYDTDINYLKWQNTGGATTARMIALYTSYYNEFRVRAEGLSSSQPGVIWLTAQSAYGDAYSPQFMMEGRGSGQAPNYAGSVRINLPYSQQAFYITNSSAIGPGSFSSGIVHRFGADGVAEHTGGISSGGYTWKMFSYSNGAPAATGYVYVTINGVGYKLLAAPA